MATRRDLLKLGLVAGGTGLGEDKLVALRFDADRILRTEATFEDFLGERVFKRSLDRALQRPGPEQRVEAHFG